MTIRHNFAQFVTFCALFALSACGDSGLGRGSLSSGGIFSGENSAEDNLRDENRARRNTNSSRRDQDAIDLIYNNDRETIWDLFTNKDNPNTTLEVNKFIWVAALDVLDFLPVEAADPFSGIIVTGYGRPPGGRTAYRATIHVTDPALDARSLNLALERQGGGAVDADTVHAIEDAILTRARQLRIQHGDL